MPVLFLNTISLVTKLLQFLANQVHHFTVGLCMQSLTERCHFLMLSRGTTWNGVKFCSASVAVTQTIVRGLNGLRSLEASLISLLDSICGYLLTVSIPKPYYVVHVGKEKVYKCFTLKIVSDFKHCPVVYGSQ